MAELRITRARLQAAAAGTPELRVSRIRLQAAFAIPPPGGGGSVGGTNPGAANIPTTTPEFFGLLEELDDGTVVGAWAEQLAGPFADSGWYGDWKDAKILQFGSITRKASTPGGGIQLSTQTITLADTDRAFRKLWAHTPIRGRKWNNYTVDHASRIAKAAPFRLSAGFVGDHRPEAGLTYVLEVEGALGRHIARLESEKLVPPNLISPTDNPILAARFADGWAPPIGYGALEDETTPKPQGVVPGVYIGTANLQTVFGAGAVSVVGDFYAFFGHAVQSTLNLYVTPAAWTASTAYLAGDRIRPNVTSNGFLYQCTVAGTSGSSAPTFSTTIGATFSDGSVTWQNVGADDPDVRHIIPPSAYGQVLIEPHKDPTSWAAATGTSTPYVDYNGFRYHIAIIDNGHRFAKAIREGRISLSGNFRGIEDVGDSTGALIDAPARILQHFWTNFVEDTWKIGPWATTPPTFGLYSLFDTTTIDAVTTYTNTLVSGGPAVVAMLIGDGGKQTTLFDVIKRMASSWDLKLAENRHGQIITAIDNTAAAAVASFNQQDDAIEITTTPQRSNYFNAVRYRYGYLHVAPVATQLEGEAGQPMPARSVHDHAEWASGLQTLEDATAIAQNYGKKVYLDLDLYGVRSAATAAVYAARALARGIGPTAGREGPIGVRIVTGLQGLQQGSTPIDIGTVIALTHIEGYGAAGYVGARAIVEEVSVQPDTCRVTLSGRLLDVNASLGE